MIGGSCRRRLCIAVLGNNLADRFQDFLDRRFLFCFCLCHSQALSIKVLLYNTFKIFKVEKREILSLDAGADPLVFYLLEMLNRTV
jgi:hypothetical protein